MIDDVKIEELYKQMAQSIIEGEARITLLPPKNELLPQLLAAEGGSSRPPTIPRPK